MIAGGAWWRIVRMTFTIEFADSELRDVVAEGAAVRLRFAAAAVRDEAGERGWLASVQVEMSGASLHGDTAQAFGRVAEGALRCDGTAVRLSVPGHLSGDIDLALRLAHGTQLVVRGSALVASVAEGARFAPDLSC